MRIRYRPEAKSDRKSFTDASLSVNRHGYGANRVAITIRQDPTDAETWGKACVVSLSFDDTRKLIDLLKSKLDE